MGFAASSVPSLSSRHAPAFADKAPAIGSVSNVSWMAPLAGWLRRHAFARRAPANAQPFAPGSAAPSALRVVPSSASHAAAVQSARPLRVLRVVDGASRHCAGRMVISGRMADVCAELDRLAAREALRDAQRDPSRLN